MVLRYLLPLVFLVGCMPPEADGFGGSGSKNSNSGSSDPEDTDDETQDTGEEDTDDPLDDRPDGWPEPLDPNGPSINDLQGKFDEYPNMGTVVEVSFGFWDGQSDVQGGADAGDRPRQSRPVGDRESAAHHRRRPALLHRE